MRIPTQKIVLIPLFSAIIGICAWIQIPLPFTPISFTMQLFGVFLALCCLGGRDGTLAILLYLILGAVGVPVFAGFQGGIAILLQATGGYLWGFLLIGIAIWISEKFPRYARAAKWIGPIVGLFLCYVAGTAWFAFVYTARDTEIGVLSVLSMCVFPYIVPDLIKLLLAERIARRLHKYVKNR